MNAARRVVCIAYLVLAGAARAGSPAQEEYLAGQAQFAGGLDLSGRIYTHRVDLPPAVVRCANCHAVTDGPAVPRSLAPRLTRDLLLRPQSRRGGPASVYDNERLCTLLRKGVDPAFVLISVQMPRYAIDDAGCRALWRYLTGSADDENAG
jgi:hypothetical protein